jgi:hypothetical protein
MKFSKRLFFRSALSLLLAVCILAGGLMLMGMTETEDKAVDTDSYAPDVSDLIPEEESILTDTTVPTPQEQLSGKFGQYLFTSEVDGKSVVNIYSAEQISDFVARRENGEWFSLSAEDMLFIKELNPQMIGIGPFVPHHDTPFAKEQGGTLELTLFMLGLLRLMIPKALLPSTTALGTIDPNGRELGILAGANVVMPNLSPSNVRKKYLLYDNKICTGDEAAESLENLKIRMKKINYDIVVSRGDSLN